MPEQPAPTIRGTWYRPMAARESEESHRASTPLELLFDLCFVVAIAQAATSLHHALTENHIGHALLGYTLVFFGIWWAWVNFTWFASAYDTDDVLYRLTTLLQIAGGLVLAAGVSRAFDREDFTVMTAGYVLMRLAMVIQWLRAARSDPPRRQAALRYAAGITVIQICWVARLALPHGLLVPGFALLGLAELVIPIVAEHTASTTWHRGHIAERYGLFTLIVLGESVLSATTSIQAGIDSDSGLSGLISLSVAGLVIVFSMWWLYFGQVAEDRLTTMRAALTWGYGHLLIFASAAGVGAGLAVAVDYHMHATHLPSLGVGLASTVPVALYLLCVWALNFGPRRPLPITIAFPVTAVLVLIATFAPAPVHVTAVLLAAMVTVFVLVTRRVNTGSRAR